MHVMLLSLNIQVGYYILNIMLILLFVFYKDLYKLFYYYILEVVFGISKQATLNAFADKN